MTIIDSEEGRIITLSKAFDTRPKKLNMAYFVFFTIGATFFTLQVQSERDHGPVAIFFFIVIVGVYLLISYRFLNKALETEKMIVNKTTLKIIRMGFSLKPAITYDISLISNFRLLEKPGTSRHPLAGESFDYMGFQTEQQMINEMHGDNRLAFDYQGRVIKFGENIYSWDFQQLEVLLYDITGNDFRYTDEFEKMFKADD
jgi:hypothetical protein